MLRRNMTSAECQISDPKGRYLVFTLLFFQMPMMKTQGLNTKIITKKPKSARNCESRVSFDGQHVWFASGDKLNAFDPASGKMMRSIDVAAHAGTAFDGKHLFQIAEDRI